MLKLGEKIVKYRIVILVLAVLLLIPSVFGMVKTRINYDILSYLPTEIDTMKGQDILLDEFGTGAYAFLIVDNMEDKDVAKLEEKVEQIDHVKDVIWYDDIMDLSVPINVLPDEVRDAFNSDSSTMMFVLMDEGTSTDNTMEAITNIRKVCNEQCFLSSMSAIVTDIRDMVNKELVAYVAIAAALAALVLGITLDSFMIPVLFLLSIGMAILYNMGTNVFKGEISFVTMALAAVLQLAVTMDYSIFLYESYKEEMAHYEDHKEAMAVAISLTINSITGSSLTTIAGFLALCAMSFTLGRDLGIVMAKGVLIGVISCVTILPALLLTFDKAIERTKHKSLHFNMGKLSKFVVKHSRMFAIIMIILWIPSIYGYNHNKVYYKLDSSLPDYLPSVVASQKLSDDYEMSTVHMVLYSSNLDSKSAHQMIQQIKDTKGITMALGIDSLVGSSLPESLIPEDVRSVLESDDYKLLIVGSEYEVATDEVNEQCDTLSELIHQYDANAMLIGEAPATSDLITITDHDFTVVNIISILVIFLLIALVLKSFSLPVILVAVIELAIYINLGMSYYLNTTLAFIASICISTIQLGSTVDYAILMTNRYKRERIDGKDKVEAATIALETSIHSIMTSAFGFFAATIGVGLYSDVDLIGSLCVLMGRGALISLTVVAFILPSMYLLCDKVICKTTFGMTHIGKTNKKAEIIPASVD